MAIINKPEFGSDGDAMFAVIDGGLNEQSVQCLTESLPQCLQAELSHNCRHPNYLKYVLLSAHRLLLLIVVQVVVIVMVVVVKSVAARF